MDNLNLMHSAITYFVREPVLDMTRFDETIGFVTESGRRGSIERNYVGNYDVWIGEDVVYEIESDLFELIERDGRGENLIGFYELLKTEDISTMKAESKQFFGIVLSSVEKIITNFDLPIVGSATIGITQLFYTGCCKFTVHLN